QVLGVVLAHEVLVLPPSASEVEDAEAAAAHPDAREVRMVVGVLRGGAQAAVLRLRGVEGTEDERVTGPDRARALADALHVSLRGAEGPGDALASGPDLAPALADALHATLRPGSRPLT